METLPFLVAFIVVYLAVFVLRDQLLVVVRKALVFSGLRQATPEEYLLLRGWCKVSLENGPGYRLPGDEFVYATSAALAFEYERRRK